MKSIGRAGVCLARTCLWLLVVLGWPTAAYPQSVPSQTVPSQTVPSQTVPSQTVMSKTGSSETLTFDWYHAGGDVHRPATHVPLHVVLGNPSREDRKVRLEGSWEALAGEVHRQVELAAGARKEVDFYLGPTGLASNFKVILRAVPSLEVIEEVQLSSIPVDPARTLVGLLSPHPMGWPSLSRGGDLESFLPGGAKIVTLDPVRLPGAIYGLEAFDVLVWPRPEPWRLREEQLRALLDWLDDGGHLVLAGPESGRQALEPWTRTVAGEPRVVHRLDALAQWVGVPLESDTLEKTVTPLVAPADQVWLRESWGALATEERRGIGRLTVLGFDPSALGIGGWPGLGRFWLRLLERSGVLENDPLGGPIWSMDLSLALPTVARSMLTQDQGGPGLPVAGLAMVLLLYLIAIGPGEYLLLRRLGKLHWTWISFPLWVALASAGAYAVAAGTRGNVDSTRHLLVRDLVPGATSVRERLHASLFATRAGRYRLAPQRPGGLPRAQIDSIRQLRRRLIHHHRGGRSSGSFVMGHGASASSVIWPTGSSRFRRGPIATHADSIFSPTFHQGSGTISSRLAKWSFLAGSFEWQLPAEALGLAVEVTPRADGVSPQLLPRLGLELDGAWLLTSQAGQPQCLRLRPRGDGEAIPLEGTLDAKIFETGSWLSLQLLPDPKPEHFVQALAVATVRNLLLAKVATLQDPSAWAALIGVGEQHDWSSLLSAGGGVFLGWGSDLEPRLDSGPSVSGTVIYRIGLTPEALAEPQALWSEI